MVFCRYNKGIDEAPQNRYTPNRNVTLVCSPKCFQKLCCTNMTGGDRGECGLLFICDRGRRCGKSLLRRSPRQTGYERQRVLLICNEVTFGTSKEYTCERLGQQRGQSIYSCNSIAHQVLYIFLCLSPLYTCWNAANIGRIFNKNFRN